MMHRFAYLLVCTLLIASFMWASEGAIDGAGLHLAVLWVVAAALSIIAAPTISLSTREAGGSRFSLQPHVVGGIGLLLLVTGFWVSTWHVFSIHGDRRAALNLSFHWTAALAALIAVRRLFTRAHDRTVLVLLLAGLCFGASVQGILQYHVIYSQQAQWYTNLRQQLDGAEDVGGMTAVVQRREIQAEFGGAGAPLSGPSRELFERRLLSSTEPVGPFALANTLAGFLAMGVVLILGSVLVRLRAGRGNIGLLWAVPALLAIGYCLVLTKSRTAWVGTGVGVGLLLLTGKRRPAADRRVVVIVGVTTLALLGAGVVGGALDREVLLESLRSLQFRWHYWTGAAGVIGDNPVFGAGPGNFRQVYLAYKPMASSEEILDPHNVLLDAWSSAGIVGFVGVLLIVGALVRAAFRLPGKATGSEVARPQTVRRSRCRRTVWISVVSAILLHSGWRWFHGGPLMDLSFEQLATSEDIVWLVPLGALVMVHLVTKLPEFSPRLLSLAGVVLFIHLLAAGGLQVAAIGCVLGILLGLLTPEGQLVSGSGTIFRSLCAGGVAAVAAVMMLYGLKPVLDAGVQDAVSRSRETLGDRGGALRAAEQGIDNDPWDVALRQRSCTLLAYQLRQCIAVPVEVRAQSENDELSDLFSKVKLSLTGLIQADRRRWQSYVMSSDVHRLAAAAALPHASLEQSAADLQAAIDLYPTRISSWVTQAELQMQLDQPERARRAARRAITIDELNRTWGHVERYLTAEQLARMHGLCDAVGLTGEGHHSR